MIRSRSKVERSTIRNPLERCSEGDSVISLKQQNLFLLVFQILCFWPIWNWYVLRINDGSDEPWGILALVTVILLTAKNISLSKDFSKINLGINYLETKGMFQNALDFMLCPKSCKLALPKSSKLALPKSSNQLDVVHIKLPQTSYRDLPLNHFQLSFASFFTILYLLTYNFCPPLIKALLAIFAILPVISSFFGVRLSLSIFGLLVLSLPIIASLQFYLGFPVRFLTAFLTSQLLNLCGYFTVAEGTLLHWRGEIISVDAPCSGIKMLWSGLYLCFTLCVLRNLGFSKTWISYSFAALIIFLGNLLRNFLLFFTESGIVPAPEYMHSVIGLCCFSLIAIGIFVSQRFISQRFVSEKFVTHRNLQRNL